MTTEIVEPVSEQLAKDLLAELQAFQNEWAMFADESRAVFEAFRTDGASLPESFHSGYQSLMDRKAALAHSIADRTSALDEESWTPPAADESLHEFEDKLKDLAELVRELAHVVAEKQDRYIRTLSDICAIECQEPSILDAVAEIRNDAEQERELLSSKVFRLADLDLEEKIHSFQSLLSLVEDAAALANRESPRARMNSSECQSVFQAVTQRFGMLVAIEALRNGLRVPPRPVVSDLPEDLLTPSLSDNELSTSEATIPLETPAGPKTPGPFEVGISPGDSTPRDAPPVADVPTVTKDPAAVNAVNAVNTINHTADVPADAANVDPPALSETPANLGSDSGAAKSAAAMMAVSVIAAPTVGSISPAEIATKNQIQALVQNFAAKPQVAPVPLKKIVSVHPAASSVVTNPVSLSELASAGTRLKKKADELWPQALDRQQLENNLCQDKIRAMGFGCLWQMIEMAGYIFGERGRSPKFFSKLLHDFLQLFAEVQTAVRTEAEDSFTPPSPEQATAFRWLRHTCSPDGEKIHLERFMKLDERVEPADNPKLTGHVFVQFRQLAGIRKREQVFQDLKRCCSSLAQIADVDPHGMATPMWTQVNNCVRQLIVSGVKPTEVALREVLLPIVDSLPETVLDENGLTVEQGIDASDELLSVIDSIHSFLSQQADEPEQTRSDEPTADVRQVRSWLKGKTLVIVGGVCKPHAASRIKQNFQLADVQWLEATKQDKVYGFRSDLKGAAIVILITKIIGHKHNDVRQMAKDAGIPSVQLRHASGYSPNAIAKAIVEQASEQLQTA